MTRYSAMLAMVDSDFRCRWPILSALPTDDYAEATQRCRAMLADNTFPIRAHTETGVPLDLDYFVVEVT